MTSLELFSNERMVAKPSVDWGTGELQTDKFDPTYNKAPTYLLKNQPIKQLYRENNLELSNVRMNDQLMPSPFKINMLEKQIRQPFPMQHPFTSHMSYNALFPSYIAPEDAKRGEAMLKSISNIYDVQTPSNVDKTVVVKKTHGFPWRHEIQQLQLPTQRRGVWFEDKQYYHVPKPDDQQFYSHPQHIVVPNPKLRVDERSIDSVTANVLRNKEKQLMQSTHQAEFYKDGLGTQASLNSDDLVEKKIRYDATGQINEEMKPYFKRGGGITNATLEPSDMTVKPLSYQKEHFQPEDPNKPKMMTKFEFDESLMETGRDYQNFPDFNYRNNPHVQLMSAKNLERSNTMPDLSKLDGNAYRSKSANFAQNKLEIEKEKINAENHSRIQGILTENRRHEIDLITPDRDIRLLRIKMGDLENARGAKPNLKQTNKQHINTFYNQEGKYFGERAQLYRTPVYNPYLMKQHVEAIKADPKISANYTSGSANQSQANFQMPNDSYEHRPKLFAHKVFGDFELLKRAPLEQILKDPSISSNLFVQENGLTHHHQTTFGSAYNTKKFLQEHEQIPTKSTLEYVPLSSPELEHQNIVLKSNSDKLALANFKSGLTSSLDLHTARDQIRINDKKVNDAEMSQFPRLCGPNPPEPYEPIYCAEQAGEMGDGYSKRYYSRVYDSPHANPSNPRYEPLRSDLQAMGQYEAKAYKDLQLNQEYLAKIKSDLIKRSQATETSHVDRSKDKAAKRVTDHTVVDLKEQQQPLSTYMANYTPYSNQPVEPCPPNDFYKSCDYAETVKSKLADPATPVNIITLHDKWNKSLANQMYHAKYVTSTPDLRENIVHGKKRLLVNPNYGYQFA